MIVLRTCEIVINRIAGVFVPTCNDVSESIEIVLFDPVVHPALVVRLFITLSTLLVWLPANGEQWLDIEYCCEFYLLLFGRLGVYATVHIIINA